MASVGLCIITKQIDDSLVETLNQVAPYVDTIYIQENGTPFDYKLTDLPGNLERSTFKWNNNFADARNALLKEVETDYWVWSDTDDIIQGIEKLKSTVSYMDKHNVGMMFAPYVYMTDEHGVPSEVQNRERIIKTSLPGAWHGAIHETFIPEKGCVRETTNTLQWVHIKSQEDHAASALRNRAILESEYNKTPRDIRIAYYLGLNYSIDGQYAKAIPYFHELIREGGWDEERYRAWLQIATCHQHLSQFEEAAQAYINASLELPDWPDAYFGLQQVYYEIDSHEKSLSWYKVGITKPQPQSDSAFNPIVRLYQPMKFAAFSFLSTGDAQGAFQVLTTLKQQAPHYPVEPELLQATLDALNEEKAVNAAKTLIDYASKYESDPVAVLNALPPNIKSDIRLTEERRKLIPGKKWPKESIAIYCGSSFESWGPDTLDKGMGGSEEAIVYLSRELSKLGHQVTVYNQRQQLYAESIDDKTIVYQPWTEVNPNDEFDVFVAWRNPGIVKEIKARKIIVDLHDTTPQEIVYDSIPYVDTFMFKSQYHRELYPEIPDEKCAVVGNGIKKEQFL